MVFFNATELWEKTDEAERDGCRRVGGLQTSPPTSANNPPKSTDIEESEMQVKITQPQQGLEKEDIGARRSAYDGQPRIPYASCTSAGPERRSDTARGNDYIFSKNIANYSWEAIVGRRSQKRYHRDLGNYATIARRRATREREDHADSLVT
jgi:hypothetical protein